MEEKDFEKKSTKKVGSIIAIIVALIVLSIIGGIVYLKIANSPEKIFSKVIEDVFTKLEREDIKSERIELDLSAEIETEGVENLEEVSYINLMLDMINFKFTTEIDIDQKIFNENILATYNEEEIINADVLLQNEKLYVYLNNIYNKYIEINEEYIGEEDLSEIFETSELTTNVELRNDIKEILLNEVATKEFTQEKVELNDNKVLKTTLKLTGKEITKIIEKVLNKIYEYEKTEEMKTLIEGIQAEIEYSEETENYLEISIYTKGLKSTLEKVEISIISVEEEKVLALEINKIADEETELNVLMNENSIEISEAVKMITVNLVKENDTQGTLIVTVPLEDVSGFLTVKSIYNINYNVVIEERNTLNSINIDNLTSVDYMEMYENLQNNDLLYSLLSEIIGALN